MEKNKTPPLDELITFKQLAELVYGEPVHWMTCYRWANRGLKVGRRKIQLQTERTTGNRRLTKLRWYYEFHASLQDNDQTRDEILANITP